MAGKKKKPSERKYSPKAQEKVREVLHEFKEGELESGKSHKKVKDRKQAIAIGISEARKTGAKTPPPKKRSASASKKKKSSPTKKKSTGRKKTSSKKKK